MKFATSLQAVPLFDGLANCRDDAGRYTIAAVRFSEKILLQPRWLILLSAAALTLLVGFCDYITTWELSLFVFYAVPIFLVAWYGDRRLAIVLAVSCGVVWYVANLATHPYATSRGYVWATLNRLAYFVIVAIGGTALRVQREESAARLAALDRARELERELIRAGEREQMRIGQDLHDGICQNLAAIACATECLRADVEAGRAPQAGQISLIQKMLTDTVVEARSLARGIFPVQLEDEGLPAALQELIAVTNQLRQTAIVFETSGEFRLPDPQVGVHLYRIAQEALSNAMRHSGASRVFVSLRAEAGRLVLVIDDDGRGLPTAGAAPSGIGLRTIRYRAQLIGAQLELVSKSAGGVLVRCVVPSPHEPKSEKAVA